jgi:ABC-2 type transport system ATP-binding protein
MKDDAIVIDRLAKSFGSQQVLRDVSLRIPAGQTFALLGRNGAGKTTTIRTLLGLIPPDGGSIEVAGLDPTRHPLEVRRQVGYLAEDQVMYGWMTPTELSRFLSSFYPKWDEARAQECLERFGIPPQAKIARLSKGQSVKLGLAMALAHRPKIMILDDPAMGLDPIARKEFNRDLVEHLQVSGCTVLYSSHLLDEVEAVADAVAILDQGRIVRTGATDELRENVKQIVLDADSLSGLRPPERLLDVRREGKRLVVVLDGATSYLDYLGGSGIDHEVIDLTLDEIFAAHVIGRTQAWPDQSVPMAAVST